MRSDTSAASVDPTVRIWLLNPAQRVNSVIERNHALQIMTNYCHSGSPQRRHTLQSPERTRLRSLGPTIQRRTGLPLLKLERNANEGCRRPKYRSFMAASVPFGRIGARASKTAQKPHRQNSETAKSWWARPDLNRGPSDYESPALTAELRAHQS